MAITGQQLAAPTLLICGLLAAPTAWSETSLTHPAARVAHDLSEVKREIVRLRHRMAPAGEIRPALYLTTDGNRPIDAAEMEILGDDGEVVRTLAFDGVGEGPFTVARRFMQPLPESGRDCRLTVVWHGEDSGGETLSRCRLPAMPPGAMAELRLRKALLGGDLHVRNWGVAGALSGDRDTGPLADLWRLIGSDGDGARAAEDAARSAAPDVRFAVAMCRADPWRGFQRLYHYRSAYAELMPPQFWLEYVRCALDAGIRGEATYGIERIHAGHSVSSQMIEARWLMSRYDERRGDRERALRWLRTPITRVPVELETRWRDLKSRLLLAHGRYRDAIVMLSDGRHLEPAGKWLEQFDAMALHYAMRLNYAYALSVDGREDEALSVLNRVGESPARDELTAGLRDRANNKLAWHFLSQNYGASAVRVFQRMPLDGPYSDSALLGMGWAMLAEPGKAQPLVTPPGFHESEPLPTPAVQALKRTGAIGCNQYLRATPGAYHGCQPLREFAVAEFSSDVETQARRALAFWDELIARGDHDAETLEAFLAAAHAYEKLEMPIKAREHYRRASGMADELRDELDEFVAQLRHDGLPEATRNRTTFEYPTSPAEITASVPAAVRYWKASSRTATLHQSIVIARTLERQLAALYDSPLRRTRHGARVPRLINRLKSVASGAEAALISDAVSLINEKSERVQRYHAQARLGLAESYDGL